MEAAGVWKCIKIQVGVREGWGDPIRTSWLQAILWEMNPGSGISTTKEPSSFCNSISEGDLAISSGCFLHNGEVLGAKMRTKFTPTLLVLDYIKTALYSGNSYPSGAT